MPGNGKYTPENVEKICNAVKQGVPYQYACTFGGVSEKTFYRWRERYVNFDRAIKDAEAEAIAGRLLRIRIAEDHSWQAAAWWLERRYYKEFGKSTHEHTGKDGGPIQHNMTIRDLSQFTDEQIDKMVALADEIESGALVP